MWHRDDPAELIFFIKIVPKKTNSTVTIEVTAPEENEEEKKTEAKEGDESKPEEVDEGGLRRG